MKILSREDVLNMPPPQWLFKNLLQKNSTALLYGPSNLGKSFLALELMFSLASKDSSIFEPLEDGLVLYVAGEGAAGLNIRMKAWEADRGVEVNGENVGFVETAVQLADPKSRRLFVTAVRKAFPGRKPALIIFDTLARCAVGLDENSAKDMGTLVEGLEAIRREFDCSVLLVHHSTKASPKTERGSSAVFGAVDTVLSLLRDGANMKLECPKQKNGERTPSRRLTFKKCHGSQVFDARKVAEVRSQVERLQEVLTMEGAKEFAMPKRTFMHEGFPPRLGYWSADVRACAVTAIGSKIHIEQITGEDKDFDAWLKAGPKFRQESRDDKATVHPFAFIGESEHYWDADSKGRDELLEKRREYREDVLAGNGITYPATPDAELAWWIWGVAEMGLQQSEVMRYLDITRGVLQRYTKCWREYGLLPFRSDAD